MPEPGFTMYIYVFSYMSYRKLLASHDSFITKTTIHRNVSAYDDKIDKSLLRIQIY